MLLQCFIHRPNIETALPQNTVWQWRVVVWIDVVWHSGGSKCCTEHGMAWHGMAWHYYNSCIHFISDLTIKMYLDGWMMTAKSMLQGAKT